jgi:hypothetical protein
MDDGEPAEGDRHWYLRVTQHPFFSVVYFLIAAGYFARHEDVLSRLISGAVMLFVVACFVHSLWQRFSTGRRRPKDAGSPPDP